MPQPVSYLHGKPAPIRRKRQSFDFQALTSRNKANQGHRFSQQLPASSDRFRVSETNSPKASIDLSVKGNDTAVRVELLQESGEVIEKGTGKVSRHKFTRSIETDDITGFWSRRLTAQKRNLAVKQATLPEPKSFRERTFSSTAALSATQPAMCHLATALTTNSSSSPASPPMHRTLRRKPTMGPPPPPKDRHTLRMRGNASKGDVRPATSPQVAVPRKSRSAPLQNSSSDSALVTPQKGTVHPSSSSRDSLPFPSTQNESGKEDKGRSAKLFPPITFGKIVSSMTRRSTSVPTTPVGLPVAPSSPSANQHRSAFDTSLGQQSVQEKSDRDRRRKTGLEQIVVDAGRDKQTYTRESETEEVQRILEQLRKLKAA